MTKEEKAAYNKKYKAEHREKIAGSLREWKSKNKSKVLAYARQHRKDNPDYYRDARRKKYDSLTAEQKALEYCKILARLRKTYGFTGTMFEDRLAEQDKKCAICKISDAVAADHNHKTCTPRGILCKPCNHFIGLAKESIPILESAILYLRRWA